MDGPDCGPVTNPIMKGNLERPQDADRAGAQRLGRKKRVDDPNCVFIGRSYTTGVVKGRYTPAAL